MGTYRPLEAVEAGSELLATDDVPAHGVSASTTIDTVLDTLRFLPGSASVHCHHRSIRDVR